MVVRTLSLVIAVIAFLLPAELSGVAQTAESKPASTLKVTSSQVATLKKELLASIELSKLQQSIRRRVQISVQGKEFDSVFEYASPDRFRLYETTPSRDPGEAVEIGRHRYQKYDGQWIKVRKDPYPLREQFFDVFFPTQLIAKRGDVFKIENLSIASLGTAEHDGKKFSKYQYAISYSGVNFPESGIAWVNLTTGLLERVETGGVGIAGVFTALWTYDYASSVDIVAPASFIEKDWVN